VCLVCNASGSFEPALAALARCRACGFVTWPRAEHVDSNTLYDERYFTEVDYPDYLGSEPSLRRSMVRHLEQMSHFAAHRGALLEIGCAYGFFLDEARHHYDRVAGVDVAAAAVERARRRFGVEAHAGSLLDIPFEDASFDVVCMWDTVEHLPRADRFIERARELLRPDGRLFLTTGDISSLNARVRAAKWRQIHPPSHVHYFSRQTIATLLGRLGFRVLGFETAAYYHSLYNVLASMALQKGRAAGLSRTALRLLGERFTRGTGLWINLGDIMFVAATPTSGAGESDPRSAITAERGRPMGPPLQRSDRSASAMDGRALL
jgi:SAM-dependent methyltransferase